VVLSNVKVKIELETEDEERTLMEDDEGKMVYVGRKGKGRRCARADWEPALRQPCRRRLEHVQGRREVDKGADVMKVRQSGEGKEEK